MELKPWEFERLQPHEFMTLIDCYMWRNESHEDMMAYFICALMNVEGKSLKHPISPKELMEPLRKTDKSKNKSQDEAYLREKFKNIL